MTLEQADGEAAEPREIIRQGAFARAAVIFSEGHIQHPVHGFNAPVAANGFRESFAADIASADVVAHLTGFATVRMYYPTHRVADRFDIRPIAGGSKPVRRLGEVVSPFVDATVACLAGLAHTILKVCEITRDVFMKECFNGVLQFRLIILDGDD